MLMDYWQALLVQHPADAAIQKHLAHLTKKFGRQLAVESKASEYVEGVATAGESLSSLGLLALGSGTPPSVIDRVAASGAAPSSSAPSRPSDEEAQRRSRRDVLRKKLDDAVAQRNEVQMKEALEKGFLREHYLQGATNRYEDLLKEFKW